MDTKSAERVHLEGLAVAAESLLKEGATAERNKLLPAIRNALDALELIERMVQEQKKRLTALLTAGD